MTENKAKQNKHLDKTAWFHHHSVRTDGNGHKQRKSGEKTFFCRIRRYKLTDKNRTK
ncbi:MAG: hypothetical protein JXB48_17465 [Candidatus Latescibacteria bacterium]|nr:hypothetical protein [Candidatus Latescibacterota bacterium]